MPPHATPRFQYAWDYPEQIHRLKAYLRSDPARRLPDRRADRLLVATWNIANLGSQRRTTQDYALLAEVISWFDLVALQEVNEELQGLFCIQQALKHSHRAVFSDSSGNSERLAFLYDSLKLKLREEIGEVALPPQRYQTVRIPGVATPFQGFDRNPYLATFESKQGTKISFVNVHSFYGSESRRDEERRSLEAAAIATWCNSRRRRKTSYSPNVVALGDFNMPKPIPGDATFDALTRWGFELPGHSTRVGSSIANDRRYDQIAVFPRNRSMRLSGRVGVIDFDGAIFPDLWARRTPQQFRAYLRYHISDHRPMWIEFEL